MARRIARHGPHVLRHPHALTARRRRPIRATSCAARCAGQLTLGFAFYTHPEVEFFLLRDRPQRGLAVPPPVDQGGYFDLTPHDVSHDFRRDAITMLEQMGISVEFSHHEVAPGQQEIDLRYADALTTADNIMTFRLVVKEVALQQGVYATFMPKPYTDQPGSAMHTHVSLFEGDRNAFYDPDDPLHLSKVGRSFIAGLLAHSAEITAVTNQWVNSYKRLSWGGEAPSLRELGSQQPQRARARADVQAEQGPVDACRAARAGLRLQPLPDVRARARGRPRRRPEGLRAATRGGDRRLAR